MSLRAKMGAVHERWLVSVLGGRKTKASGSQWADPMDGRHDRRSVPFAFAWDGKSTLAKSISVTREMWRKAREQAGGERPMLALRFYDTEALDVHCDLAVISVHDLADMLDAVNSVRSGPVQIFVSTRSREEEEDLFLEGEAIIRSNPYAQPLVVMDGEVLRPDWISYTTSAGVPSVITAAFGTARTDFPGRQVDLYVDNVLRVSVGVVDKLPARALGKVW